jgi:hypothetical protein
VTGSPGSVGLDRCPLWALVLGCCVAACDRGPTSVFGPVSVRGAVYFNGVPQPGVTVEAIRFGQGCHLG